MEMKAIINVNIYDFESYREDQYVLYDEEIIEVGPMASYKGWDVETVDGKGNLLMPSLVNAHSHIYSAFARGMSVPFDPKNFQEILDQLWWKLDGVLDNEAVYASGLVHAVDTVKNGVTTLIDHHASGRGILGSLESLNRSVCKDVGLRGIFCFETSDRFDVSHCIDENMAYALNHQKTYTTGMFGMHASMSLSEETLKRISAKRAEIPVHVHVAESRMDEQQSQSDYNKSVIERYDEAGLLDGRSLLAHCLHINEKDAAIIAGRGAKVVLNVTSNMNNAVGLPDYNLFKKYGIPVLIGNDGISASISTEWLNLYFTMHHKYASPVGFGLDDLKQVIRNNYDYVSDLLGVQLGRIDIRYVSDMMLVPYCAPTPMNAENAMGHIFFGIAGSLKPSHVWCRGESIVTAYQVPASLEDAYTQAKTTAAKVWERVAKTNG